jgi:hypothetical protein
MNADEWRITMTTIEAEMLRLAALLSTPSRSPTMHPGVARHDEAKASNLALEGALKAVRASGDPPGRSVEWLIASKSSAA